MPAIAMVTGAGSGIGRSCSLQLVRDGWHVVLVGRREEALRATQAAAIELHSDSATVHAADVTSEEDVEQLFSSVEGRFGRLDLLFNNAGVNVPATSIDQLSLDDWRRVIDVNLTGVFLCTRAAFALMKRQDPRGGRIINNGSISAHVPRPLSLAYTAAKHGVTGLTRATALDGRPLQIVCGQIDIGNAATDMTDRMSGGVLQADGTTASEPTFHVDHVAQAVSYMAGLPLDANVPFMTVMANGMPYIGRG